MKISVVGNNWFPTKPGGLDRYIFELVHALAAGKTQVDLYSIGLPEESSLPNIQLKNLADAEVSLQHRLVAAFSSLRHLRQSQTDAVNLHFALYGLSALPHLPADIPVTCTFHGPWALESQQEGESFLGTWLKKQLEQVVYRRCDRFIVLSKAFGEILSREYGIGWEKIHVIPGGVDVQRFRCSLSRQQAREELGWPQDRFILFTPRRLVNRMGLDKLLSAIALLTPHVQTDMWLAIAGKGPQRAALEAQAKHLNLTNTVRFLGFLPDELLPVAYQAADLTIMPSQSLEGFGLVLLESLASGTPVLCTPVGGMPEVVTQFSPELITSSPKDQAISDTLESILSGEIKLPNRHACRQYAANEFSWPIIAERVKQVLLSSSR